MRAALWTPQPEQPWVLSSLDHLHTAQGKAVPHYCTPCLSPVGGEKRYLLRSLPTVPGCSSVNRLCSFPPHHGEALLACFWEKVPGIKVEGTLICFTLTHHPEAGHLGVGLIAGPWLALVALLSQLSYLAGGKCWENEETRVFSQKPSFPVGLMGACTPRPPTAEGRDCLLLTLAVRISV